MFKHTKIPVNEYTEKQKLEIKYELTRLKSEYIINPVDLNQISYNYSKLGNFSSSNKAFILNSLREKRKSSLQKLIWTGREDSKNIDLYAFYRYGETFIHSLWLPILRDAGIHITFYCDSNLYELYSKTGLIDEIKLVRRENLGNFNSDKLNKKFTLMSPNLYGLAKEFKLNNLSTEIFRANESDFRCFSSRYLHGVKTNILIGINWGSSSPKRSVPLEVFKAISEIPNVRLISLQKKPLSEDLETVDFNQKFIDSQSELEDETSFYSTFLAIKSCDVVITCDTAVAHLAGFSKVLTYLLLYNNHDSRWQHGDSIPPYPNMKIKRLENSNWKEIINLIVEEIVIRFN